MVILTELDKDEVEKIVGDIIFLSSQEISRRLDEEAGDYKLKYKSILLNQKIQKEIRTAMSSSKKMKKPKPVVYQVIKFDHKIIGNIKNFIVEKDSSFDFKTTEQEYKQLPSETQELFDGFV